MAPCPSRLDSVEVHNHGQDEVTVIVYFDNHKEASEIQEEQIIAPGASFHFQEKILDMGSWTVRIITCTTGLHQSSTWLTCLLNFQHSGYSPCEANQCVARLWLELRVRHQGSRDREEARRTCDSRGSDI